MHQLAASGKNWAASGKIQNVKIEASVWLYNRFSVALQFVHYFTLDASGHLSLRCGCGMTILKLDIKGLRSINIHNGLKTLVLFILTSISFPCGNFSDAPQTTPRQQRGWSAEG